MSWITSTPGPPPPADCARKAGISFPPPTGTRTSSPAPPAAGGPAGASKWHIGPPCHHSTTHSARHPSGNADRVGWAGAQRNLSRAAAAGLAERLQYLLGRDWERVHARANGVRDGVGDRRGSGDVARLA